METKYIELSGYICQSLMMGQIIEKSKLFEFCKRRFNWLNEELFNTVIHSLHIGGAITGITDKFLYQTTSCLIPQKLQEEIMMILKQ